MYIPKTKKGMVLLMEGFRKLEHVASLIINDKTTGKDKLLGYHVVATNTVESRFVGYYDAEYNSISAKECCNILNTACGTNEEPQQGYCAPRTNNAWKNAGLKYNELDDVPRLLVSELMKWW